MLNVNGRTIVHDFDEPVQTGQRLLLMFAEAGGKKMHAYTGKILHVDMTTQTTRVQTVEPEFLKKYLGGVGLATRLVYDNTPAGCDPLGLTMRSASPAVHLPGRPFR